MRFDATPYYHVGVPQYPWARVIDEIVETARLLEQLGFTTIWFAEHHFAWDGWYRAFPNPILVGTTVGAKTEKLRIGQCGVNLPDRHPVHVAEDIAFLDQATKGRVDFGVMRGLNGRWNHQFNPDADRRDQVRNYELFTECLEIVTKALSQDSFSHEGKFYRIPAPGWKDRSEVYPLGPPYYSADGEMVRLGVTPRPYQQPHPPIWQMADTNDSHAFAGARGLGAMCFTRPIDGIYEAWSEYHRAARAAGRDVAFGEGLCVMKPCYVAPTTEEAFRRARPGVNRLYPASRLRDRFARQALMYKDEVPGDGELESEWFEFLMKRDHLWVGSPEFVVERMRKYVTALNCRHFALFTNIPG